MNGKITEEEIGRAAEEKRKNEKDNDPITLKILEGLRAGKTCTEIAKEINFGSARVVKRKDKLIEERKSNSRRNRCSG